MSAQLSSLLPPGDGLLPKWLAVTCILAIGNSIQAYSTLHFTQRVYNGGSPKTVSPVTPLSARTFGTWTLMSALTRLFAAYNINNPSFYQLAFLSYILAFAHFTSEWFVFKTSRWGAGLAGPVIVSTSTLIWMWTQWDHYVQY
ncbi:ergosterol 28 [Dendryphion nanum]|uniref:Ergosterol 28 n=1 Tax=Dendryphion nanum TaxID=256645 RepID=A0A9P9DK99_9PLEO|nr:ergosterol 28 [Dendryphion nanum]